MISDPIVEAIIHQCIGDVNSSSEDLIQMPTVFVGDRAVVHCMLES